MSQVPPPLTLQEADAKAMLACGVHLGNENCDASMIRYVHKRNEKGIHIIDIRKTWEKIVLAARTIVAIENSKDVCVVALSPAGTVSYAQRAVLKFAHHIGTRSIAGRITPGTFTNHRQVHYMEPRLLITSDPRIDHQPISEASYVNLPVISFANSHHSLRGVDIAIPCNTSGKHSIALMYWMLAREVLRLRDSVPRDRAWEVMVDMFVYRDPEESEKQQAEDGTFDKSYTGWASAPAGETHYQEPEADAEVPPEEFAGQQEEWVGGGEQWQEGTEGTADWGAPAAGGGDQWATGGEW
jgi:small subunit ribosomal protein SAe